MSSFIGIQTRIMLFVVLLGSLLAVSSGTPASAGDRTPLMDLEIGGVDFFTEISPSIVQVFNGGGSGSGYIIDREGHFITNAHVTAQVTDVEIAFYGDEENTRSAKSGRFHGKLIAEDPALDLAVVQVDAPSDKFYPIRLGDSALMKPGDTVATFGSPGGDPGWVDRSFEAMHDSWLEFYNLNLGVITEVFSFEESYWTANKFFSDQQYNMRVGIRDYGSAVEYLFHTDSAINAGNSGGPCLNVYGEAVGTNTWGFGGENVGMSVPVNLLKRSVTDILEYGRVRRPWCGIALHPSRVPQQSLQNDFNSGTFDFKIGAPYDTTPEELKIYTVNPYSPAYEAGIREGDVLVRIDGKTFENIFDVYSYFLGKELGDEVVIEYTRNNNPMPTAMISMVEKKTRYFGREIYMGGQGTWVGSATFYSSNITY